MAGATTGRRCGLISFKLSDCHANNSVQRTALRVAADAERWGVPIHHEVHLRSAPYCRSSLQTVSIRWHRCAVTFSLVASGCSTCARTDAPSDREFSTRPEASPSAAPQDAARIGEPIVDLPHIYADLVPWEVQGQVGKAWRVRLPRATASLEVLSSPDIEPITEFPLPSSTTTWAAINGGFYDAGPMGLVVSNGREVAPLQSSGGSGILVVSGKDTTILHASDWPVPAEQALQSIDRIVVRGANVVAPQSDPTRAARSAVVLTPDHIWLVIAAADGSISSAGPFEWQLGQVYGQGMTLHEFASWLSTTLPVDDALNLDGGLSTQMIVQVPKAKYVVHGVSGTINALLAKPSAR